MKWTLATVLLCLPVLASASVYPDIAASSIRSKQAEIRAGATTRSGAYERLKDEELVALEAEQEKIDGLLSSPSVESSHDLSGERQVELFNAMAAVEAIVNDVRDRRMICERFRPIGSNRPKTRCATVAERRGDAESADAELLRKFQFCYKGTAETCLMEPPTNPDMGNRGF